MRRKPASVSALWLFLLSCMTRRKGFYHCASGREEGRSGSFELALRSTREPATSIVAPAFAWSNLSFFLLQALRPKGLAQRRGVVSVRSHSVRPLPHCSVAVQSCSGIVTSDRSLTFAWRSRCRGR